MLREHPGPRGDPREDQPLRAIDASHRRALVRPPGPLEPDCERLVLAAEGVARGLALGVVPKPDERLGPALDPGIPEEAQEEVVVRRVDVRFVEQARTLQEAPPEDDRRRGDVVAEVEVPSPAELGRAVLAPDP